MINRFLFKLYLVSCFLVLGACEKSQLEEQRQKSAPQVVTKEKLDLEVTPEMLEEVLGPAGALENDVEKGSHLNLGESSDNRRIELKGRVLIDETEEDYREAVDGAVIEMEVKLK